MTMIITFAAGVLAGIVLVTFMLMGLIADARRRIKRDGIGGRPTNHAARRPRHRPAPNTQAHAS